MAKMNLPLAAVESRLTSLPAEIRYQIYTHLFDSWALHIKCTRIASRTSKDDKACGGAPRSTDVNLRVVASEYPNAAFMVCRKIYHDLRALQPLPVATIHIECDAASASILRGRFKEILESLSDRVACLRAKKLVVNQDGVYGLDIGLVKGRMADSLGVIEVEMRDLALNAQYAPAWVRKALETDGEVVKCEEQAQEWASTDFAFGYLHSYLGWEVPGPRRTTDSGCTRLLARQEVTVSAEKRCVAHLSVVHDIEKRRVLEVQKRSVNPEWRQYLERPKALPHSHPVPFFGAWSCLDIAASARSFVSAAVN